MRIAARDNDLRPFVVTRNLNPFKTPPAVRIEPGVELRHKWSDQGVVPSEMRLHGHLHDVSRKRQSGRTRPDLDTDAVHRGFGRTSEDIGSQCSVSASHQEMLNRDQYTG